MSDCWTPPPLPTPLLTSTAQYLADAQAAYHALMTGTAVVRLKDQNGEEVEYTPMSAPRLLAYIQVLQDNLNPCRRISRPMGLLF